MTIELTEEQEMLRASARDFLEKECTELVLKDVEAGGLGYSPELWRKIAQLGWLGLVLPEPLGGSGMGLVDLAVLCEELGRAGFPGPYVPAAVVAGLAVAELGNDRQKSDLLPGLIAGDTIAVVTLDEPGPASPAMVAYESGSVAFQATSDGAGFVLHGGALFVAYASLATTFLVPARTSVSRHQDDGITLFLVAASAPGITVTPLTSLAGDNPCEVALDGVHVTRESILGQAGRGWPPLHRSVQVGAVMLSAQMLGAGERLLQLSSDDYATRLRADASAADPYTREYLSRLRQDLDLCRSATYHAAQKLAFPRSPPEGG